MFRSLLAVLALAVPLLGAALVPPATAAPQQRLDFDVMRKGERIGSHTMQFARDGETTRVAIRTDVAVKLPIVPIPVYRFEHDGSERWVGGRLVELHSKTYDDGTSHTLDVSAAGDHLSIFGDGKVTQADPAIIPASLWNSGLVDSRVLLNTLDGRQMKVAVQAFGAESIPVRGRSVSARHFKVSGDLERELWYDEAGALVQVRFLGRDGSEITYVLK